MNTGDAGTLRRNRELEQEPKNERVVMHVDSHTHLVSLDEEGFRRHVHAKVDAGAAAFVGDHGVVRIAELG